ncbi:MAG TPA: STAS domain-containing protein [Casimicrobiaceae bacterium]
MSEVTPALQVEGDRWMPAGSLTMDSVATVLAVSGEAVLPATGVIDLERVEAVDSASVALLLAWRRRAAAEGKPLTFAHLPPSLASLAQLYGVEDLLAAEPN